MKVNDYVRTKQGIIDKIIIEYNGHCADANCNCKHVSCEKDYYDEDEIINSSPNIIDLIEVGDLVKIEFYSPRYEERLQRLFEVEYKDEDWIRFNNAHCDLSIFHNQWGGNDKELNPIIKSIVTREMFKSMEYKVKE